MGLGLLVGIGAAVLAVMATKRHAAPPVPTTLSVDWGNPGDTPPPTPRGGLDAYMAMVPVPGKLSVSFLCPFKRTGYNGYGDPIWGYASCMKPSAQDVATMLGVGAAAVQRMAEGVGAAGAGTVAFSVSVPVGSEGSYLQRVPVLPVIYISDDDAAIHGKAMYGPNDGTGADIVEAPLGIWFAGQQYQKR